MKTSPPCLYFLHLLLGTSMVATGARDIYLVLLQGEAVAFRQGVTPQSHDEHAMLLMASHDQLLQTTLEVDTYTKLCSFHHIVNGFAVHTTRYQAKKLATAPGVVHVERDRRTKLMTTYTPHFLGLDKGVWNQQGGEEHAGEGTVIGVVDTGIDPTHPSFAYDPLMKTHHRSDQGHQFHAGACHVGPLFPEGSCNGKIVSARYFAAGAVAAIPMDASMDLSPYDENGHGSHVASIAAGNWGVPVVVNGFKYGTASGMAPRARLAIYKAIYPEGGTTTDLIYAIDQAARDRVDVIVLSIGPDEPPEETVTFLNMLDISLLFARRVGIFVAQAAGNKGPDEHSVVSFSPWAMGVAASTTGRRYVTTLILGNGQKIRGVGLSAPSIGNGLIRYRLISAKDATMVNRTIQITKPNAEECQHPKALKPKVVQGSIVICSFAQGFLNGTSTMTAILRTARLLEFAGFILVANPLYGDFIAEPLPLTTPGIMVSRTKDAKLLWKYYEKHTRRGPRGKVVRYNGNAAITEGRIAMLNGVAPVVARFSSRGPSIIDSSMNPADVLKPDILAPGNQIWAAWSPMSALVPILTGNNFALLSGTSMAAPHIAGIVALIKQSHPLWNPSMIASAMSTTATKHDHRGLPIMSQGPQLDSLYPSTPFDHGAGLINPSMALDPGLVCSADFEDYISFLCSLPDINPVAVKSITGIACDSFLSFPANLNTPSITISNLRGFQLVRRTIKNVATKPETYLCSILPPDGIMVDVQPSWFTIGSQKQQDLYIKLNVTLARQSSVFGEIVLTGSLDHIIRFPLSIVSASLQ